MKRRAFLSLLGIVVTLPLTAYTQQQARSTGSAAFQVVPSRRVPTSGTRFARRCANSAGWRARTLFFEFRPPAQEGDPFDELVAELVRLQVDVIVATGTRAVRAAKADDEHDSHCDERGP